MVSLKIEVKKKDVTWAVFLVVMLAVGVVYAYGTSNPSVMGHSWREINFDDDFCKYVTGSNCVGGGACVDTSWSPNSNTICSGDSFTQTSNCGNTRTTVGTMSCAPSCVPDGQLAEVGPAPYQNCQGGTYPRTSIQYNTEAWTNCCSGTISRLCAVPGYSTQNTIMCA
ncbi:hypothetical protein KAT36_00820 [Candidatus Pacearchaeota archaeon]|nr:hypothetical protein [Candidatus Pacearchaeota archaeon]